MRKMSLAITLMGLALAAPVFANTRYNSNDSSIVGSTLNQASSVNLVPAKDGSVSDSGFNSSEIAPRAVHCNPCTFSNTGSINSTDNKLDAMAGSVTASNQYAIAGNPADGERLASHEALRAHNLMKLRSGRHVPVAWASFSPNRSRLWQTGARLGLASLRAANSSPLV